MPIFGESQSQIDNFIIKYLMQGRLSFVNMTFDSRYYPTIFPQGTYKGELNVTVKDTLAGYGWATYDVISDLKHSF